MVKRLSIIASLLFLILPVSASAAFPDIGGHRYEESIRFIEARDLVDGYPDGTFGPDISINRAEFLTIIAKSNFSQESLKYKRKNCFPDVPPNEWYTKNVCFAKSKGIVKGYADGFFRPDQYVNFVEALAIIQKAYDLPVKQSTSAFWFEESVRYASSINIIPPDIDDFGLSISRGQVAEILTRLIQYRQGKLEEYLGPEKGARVTFEDIQQRKNTPLLQLDNLVYEGAFRLPQVKSGKSIFEYGGSTLAYNPKNDSLFVTGHADDQLVAEVQIPKITKRETVEELNMAKLIQPFSEPSDGKKNTAYTGDIRVGGLLVYKDQLFGSAYAYYDANRTQVYSHYISPLDLSGASDATGMYRLGELGAGFVSGYMALIPSQWHELLGGSAITGQCCIPIVGRTSFGPSAFAFHPENLGVQDPVQVTPLVYYTHKDFLGDYDTQNPYFNGTTAIRGVVFPERTRSILYFGSHGIGPFCYGIGGINGECHDPDSSWHGTHAYPYVSQIWAYDALDFIKVKNGTKKPWEIKPYGLWKFDMPFARLGKHTGGAAAYDAKTNRIYIIQPFADGDKPLVNVYKIAML